MNCLACWQKGTLATKRYCRSDRKMVRHAPSHKVKMAPCVVNYACCLQAHQPHLSYLASCPTIVWHLDTPGQAQNRHGTGTRFTESTKSKCTAIKSTAASAIVGYQNQSSSDLFQNVLDFLRQQYLSYSKDEARLDLFLFLTLQDQLVHTEYVNSKPSSPAPSKETSDMLLTTNALPVSEVQSPLKDCYHVGFLSIVRF